MKKVLIYRKESDLSPTGGPNGYLYNLREGLGIVDNNNLVIDFLPAEVSPISSADRKKIKKSLPSILVKTIKSIQHGKFVYSILHEDKTASIDINDYDLIHFQDTCSMYPLRKQLKHYNGIMVLTSHSPQPLYQEFSENATKLEKAILKKTYLELYKMDEYAFKRADYIVFPTQYSDEPYLNRWEAYRNFKKSIEGKYRYFLTGTVRPQIKRSRSEFRADYGIPDDAFVISYVGRHSAIKGYDNLIKYCEKYCSDNVYVLVAGNQGDIKAPQNNHWIEIGWTNDPYSLMNASDVFVLPNQETYFDLVLLEVLSIGTIALVSNTGGNKYFNTNQYPGVFIYNDEMDFDNKIKGIMAMKNDDKKSLNESNKKAYEEQFTTEAFAANYVKLISSLIK